MLPLVCELIDEKLLNNPNQVKAQEMGKIIKNKSFWGIISYLADLFSTMNAACKEMQGDQVNFLVVINW